MSAQLVVAAAAATCAVLVGPGLAIARLLGLRGIAAWGTAPGLTCALVGLAGAGAEALGLRWSVLLLVLLTLVLALAAAGLARRLGPRPPAEARSAGRGALAGVLLGAGFLGLGLLRSFGSLAAVPAQPDATYHLNAIRQMLVTGDISSLDGGGFLYGRAHSFYPSTFHGLAATAGMLSGAQPVVLANLLALAAAAGVWTGGCVLLCRQAFGPDVRALVLAGPASASFTAMPYLIAGYGPLWPLLLGTALVPALVAALLSLLGLAREDVLGRGRAVTVLAATVAGLAFVHPDALAATALLGYLLVAVVALAALVRGRRLLPAVALMAPPLLWLAALQLPRARAMTRAYAVGPVESPGRAVGEALLNSPRFGAPLWVTSAVVVVGLVACARTPRTRWVPAAYAVLALVFVAVAAVQDSATQLLTVYWYNDVPRLAALVPVAGVPALTAGLLAIADRVRRVSYGAVVVGALFVAATLGDNLAAHVDRLRPYYAPADAADALLTGPEATALQVLGRALPKDAVVAGNPWRGHALLFAFGSRRVAFYSEKAVTTPDRTTVADLLAQAASPLHPEVCPAVRRLGVTYVITGGSNALPNRAGRNTFAGIDGVPGQPGFVRVAVAAPYTLWRVTAC